MAEKVHIDDAELRQLMNQFSHDLRNPLAAILTNLAFAKRVFQGMTVDPDLVDCIDDSVTAGDVLRRIIGNIDVLVKGAQLTITPQGVDVADVVKDVVRRCKLRAAQANIVLELLHDDDAASRVTVDRTPLALSLENLLSNSFQHAPRGSTVQVAIEATDELVRVVVRDRGGAVCDDLRDLAVQPAGNTAAGRCDGSRYGRGLGLLSARAAAAATGVDLAVGGSGEESCFTLIIPRVAASD